MKYTLWNFSQNKSQKRPGFTGFYGVCRNFPTRELLKSRNNTYFEDFGVAAGVATTSIGGTRTGDSRYVTAVISEPGTLLLVGLAVLALRFAQKIGDRR